MVGASTHVRCSESIERLTAGNVLGRVDPQLSERVGLSAVLLSVPVWHGVTGDRVGTTRARLLNVVDAGEAEVTPEGGFGFSPASLSALFAASPVAA